MVRIDSYLSDYGICSRRKVKDLIVSKRIKVNDVVIDAVVRIDPMKDKILVDGSEIKFHKQKYIYIILNKPLNVLSTTFDDFGRKTVLDIVKTKERLYPVGRLDYNSTGLIILTNDGSLALTMTHPKFQVPKKYLVTTKESVHTNQIKRLVDGVFVYHQKTLPAKIKKLSDTSFEIEITQGMKRQIRLMCQNVGLSVVGLHRLSIANLTLGNLKPGEFRTIDEDTLQKLFKALNIPNSIS